MPAADQPVAWQLEARAGDRLLLRLDDASRLLVLQFEAPGGQPVLDGAVPGPDGLVWQVAQDGLHRLWVAVSADAARSGQSLPFTLGLRLRRNPSAAPGGAGPAQPAEPTMPLSRCLHRVPVAAAVLAASAA